MITSAQNPKLKLVRSLMGRARERRDASAFVIEGARLIEEAMAADWPFQFALYSDGLSERGRSSACRSSVAAARHSRSLLRYLCRTRTARRLRRR